MSTRNRKRNIPNATSNKNQKVASILADADAAYKQNNVSLAEKLYKKALKLNKNISMAHYNLGIIQLHKGNFPVAIKHINNAIEVEPDKSIYYTNLAACYGEMGDIATATQYFQKALSLDKNSIQAYNNFAAMLLKINKPNEAIVLLKEGLKIDPNSDKIHNNLGTAYKTIERLDLAVEHLKKSLEINPNNFEAYNNLGNTLWIVGYYDKAAECFIRAIQIKPDYYDVYSNYANLLKHQGKFQAGLEAISIAHDLKPEDNTIIWNRSFYHFLLGNIKEGWDDYEAGLIIRKRTPYTFSLKKWEDEDLQDKNIVICREQGIGDDILFANCIADLVKISKHVTITCDIRLKDVFVRSFPQCSIVPVINKRSLIKLDKDAIHDANDFEIPIGSLPKHFRQSLDSFPKDNQYLYTDKVKDQYWRNRLDSINNKLKIGITWRSGYLTQERALYYLPVEDLMPIFELDGIEFINLQHDLTDEENKFINENCKAGFTILDDIDIHNDLDNVFSLINELDIVIGIGTTNVAIAGALGKETYRLCHPHVWNMLGTNYYPWQPKVTCLVQSNIGDWHPEILKLRDILADKINN